jgi:hypothetical protein
MSTVDSPADNSESSQFNVGEMIIEPQLKTQEPSVKEEEVHEQQEEVQEKLSYSRDTYYCIKCGVDMGIINPRQYCKKTYCENEQELFKQLKNSSFGNNN